jgi:hypothetical protein
MELGSDVKRINNEYDKDILFRTSSIGESEIRLGYGQNYYAITYGLFIANAIIFGHRRNINHSFYMPAVFLLGIPFAYYTSMHLFGVKKFREIEKLDKDTAASATLYENLKKIPLSLEQNKH